ncbi:MAG: cation-translocating P-type ATPase [Gemmatimonadota bacterium]
MPRLTAGPAVPPIHVRPLADVWEALGSTPAGLTAADVAARRARVGPNALPTVVGHPPLRILAAQFKNVLVLLLLAATAISAVLGHALEGVVITVIVLVSVTLGFVQEYRAERALDALRAMAAPQAVVRRDGRVMTIPSVEVVPGDVLVLEAGQRVPADARLVEAVQLATQEAPLTGESLPVSKQPDALDDPALAPADRRNVVFAGTTVVTGRGVGVVHATGRATEFGRIAGLLATVDTTPTPLQQRLDVLGRQLARVALAVVVVVTALGVWRGEPLVEMLVFGVALAVAVVPEALPAVVTMTLALGVQRLIRRQVLVRRLTAVETLGSTSVICTDKTGTLTCDRMTVRRTWGDDPLALHRAAVLASDARATPGPDGTWTTTGDPTEVALVEAARAAGVDLAALEVEHPRIAEWPFTSESRRMTVLVRDGATARACLKGAPEAVLAACSHLRRPGADVPLDDAARAAVLAEAQAMGDDALRVLAIAERRDATEGTAQEGLTLLGLAGMSDPPRPGVPDALARCRDAGIRVVMITGDHPRTATAVARELGILGGGRVVTGAELDALDDAALREALDGIPVFARVTPEHKLRVVRAWQARGAVVAVTGDGVNDAPALKQADLGVAMGRGGTDVAREAAPMTLVDDDFASIVAAVEEGRRIVANVRKFLRFLLTSNVGEIALMALAAVAGLPMPLTAVQILYVNLATDGLPALALAVDPPSGDVMRQSPRAAAAGLLGRGDAVIILAGGLWSGLMNLAVFIGAQWLGHSVPEAMAMCFVSLVLMQFTKALVFRADGHPIRGRPFANRWLNLALAWELVLLVLLLTVPPLQRAFGTAGLSLTDWELATAAALTIVPVLGWVTRRWHGGGPGA